MEFLLQVDFFVNIILKQLYFNSGVLRAQYGTEKCQDGWAKFLKH